MVKKCFCVLSLSALLMVGGCTGVKEVGPVGEGETQAQDPNMMKDQMLKGFEKMKGTMKDGGKNLKTPDIIK